MNGSLRPEIPGMVEGTWLVQNDEASPWRRWKQIDVLAMVEFLWKDRRKFSSFTVETGAGDNVLRNVVLYSNPF